MGGGILVSILVGSFIRAVPCKEKGIGVRFSNRANTSCLDTGYSEVLRSGACEYNTPY